MLIEQLYLINKEFVASLLIFIKNSLALDVNVVKLSNLITVAIVESYLYNIFNILIVIEPTKYTVYKSDAVLYEGDCIYNTAEELKLILILKVIRLETYK